MASSRKQVNIYFHDFENEDGNSDPSQHELQVRLIEKELMKDNDNEEVNMMYIDWLEKGKIFWEPEMKDMDIMVQFKLLTTIDHNYIGSITLPLKELFLPKSNFKQWFTVFDTIDDDIFDGAIGEDDDEKPRILIGIEIRDKLDDNDDSQHSSVNELSMTKEDKPNRKVGIHSEPRINMDKMDLTNESPDMKTKTRVAPFSSNKKENKLVSSNEPPNKPSNDKLKKPRQDYPTISVSPPRESPVKKDPKKTEFKGIMKNQVRSSINDKKSGDEGGSKKLEKIQRSTDSPRSPDKETTPEKDLSKLKFSTPPKETVKKSNERREVGDSRNKQTNLVQESQAVIIPKVVNAGKLEEEAIELKLAEKNLELEK